MNIGQKIKQLRIEKGWSQEQLATLLGYKSRSSVNKIELGLTDLNQSKIFAIANIFHVDPSVFFDEMEETPKEDIERWDKEKPNLAEEVKRLEMQKEIEAFFGKQAVKMLEMLVSMNEAGQKKALEQIELLTNIPQSQKGEEK